MLAGVLLLSLNACSGNGAEEIADVEQQAGASRVTLIEATINVSETNTLQMQLEATLGENAVKVQKLVLTGEMRAVDMYYLQGSLNDLQELDMSAVIIKASTYRKPSGNSINISDNELIGALLSGKTSLRSIQFPSSIQKIGSSVCEECTALTTVTFSANLTNQEIPGRMFYGCTHLTTVDLTGSNVQKIDYAAFYGCSSLTDYVQFASITNLGGDAFKCCSGFTSVDLSNVTNIDARAFEECTSLESVTFSNQLTSIGFYAFRKTALTSVDIPASVTNLSSSAFCDNTALTTVHFAANTIPSSTFQGCTQLATVTLTDNVTTIGSSAFYGCIALTDYTPFSSVTTIENSAFAGCGFSSLDLSNVQKIGYGAFSNTPLTTLTIPSSVTAVGGRFISGCNQLTGLFWESTASVPDVYLPNCFLYLRTQNGEAPAFGPNWKNVVIDGVAESIEFNFLQQNADTPPFRCPQAFTAKKISFTRDFNNWQNTVIGASSGWYTITLPFTPTSITHPEKGELAPFGSGVESAKPFWLRQLTAEGFADVTTIEPNVSYILSLPYNTEMYADEYNIRGKVTFSAENVQIPVTPDALPASDGPTFQLCPTYQYVPMRGNVYALNTNYWVEDYNYGSVFVRSVQEVYPFEAYAVVPSSAAPAVLSLDFRSANSRAAGVRNTTGIPQIGDK